MHLDDLPTPAALIDLDVAERNATRMRERLARLGVRLRPHVKTHKTVQGVLLQLGGAPGPITVSTLAEARFFASQGFDDITYAVPLAPQRLDEVLELGRRIALGVVADHPATVAAMAAAAADAGTRLAVWIKVDCGYHRAGVAPEAPESLALAQVIADSPHLTLRGLLTHAGQAYSCRSREEIAVVATHECDAVTRFAARLEAAGVAVGDVSVGSTPTMSVVDNLTGVTEARPGNYIFYDAFQASLGSCTLADCAFTVLATVVSCHPERSSLVVDAGALALSRDDGARHLDPEAGYGVVADSNRRPLAGLRLAKLSQEHGLVAVRPPADAASYPPGTRVRIIANHSCLAAACFERFAVVRGTSVVDEWRPTRGW